MYLRTIEEVVECYCGGTCADCGGRGLAGLDFNLPEEFQNLPSYEPSEDVGQYAYNLVEQFAGMIPVAGPFIQGAMEFAQGLQQWLHLGAGRNEADIIVHDSNSGQNLLMAKLGQITDAFRTGTHPTLQQLQQMWLAVYTMGEVFKRFVLAPRFTDRRASGQALNTVMPYVDGTCGYAVPLGSTARPGQSDCLRWGDGTLGGPANDGMLGALARVIIAMGGAIPTPMLLQGNGTAVPTIGQIWPGSSPLPQSGILTSRSRPLLTTESRIIPIGGGPSLGVVALLGLGVVALASGRKLFFKSH